MFQIILTIQYVCIVGLFIEGWVVFSKWSSTLHSYLFFSCIANLVNSIGYLVELTAKSEDVYIAAMQLTYTGRVWLPFALLLFIMELSKIKIPYPVKSGLAMIHVITFVMMLTLRSHDLYYKDINFVIKNGIPILEHSNGIWHNIYDVILILYIIVGMTMLFLTFFRTRNPTEKKRVFTVIIAMLAESLFLVIHISKIWNISDYFDVTSFGYIIGTLFMLIAIFRYKLLETEQLAKEYIVERLSEGIVAADEYGNVAYYNKPAKELFPELADNSSAVLKTLDAAIGENAPIELNEHIYTPKTEILRIDEGVSAKLYVIQDHTEFYRHAKELEEMTERANSANKAKSTFLSSMSHEIRTPINAVLGMDEMIIRESTESEIVNYAEDIRTAGKTLLSLINEILDLSKIEEGKMEIIPAKYEVRYLINDLVNMISDRAENKGLKLELNIDSGIPHLLLGDEIRIKQCVLNILTNAVKYTEKGSVTFSAGFEEKDSEHILLSFRVKDTGIGMKREDMEKLFSPFARIEEERNRNIEGTGLGMSITKQLLNLMGSSLEVQSVYGEGSEFSFTLVQEVCERTPIGDYSANRLSENIHSSYRESFHAPNAVILVVDDTPINLSVIKGLLKKTQITIHTAESGRDAIKLASSRKYDMIFIDHMMPEMDGIETLGEIRKQPSNAETVCIALTANAISGAREMYLEAGFSDYLSKPVDSALLEEMIIRYLPEEKVIKGDAIVFDSDPEINGKLSVLDGISELNISMGMDHCGGAELYLETISFYASSVEDTAAEIEKYWNDGNIEDTTIKVHALKSTSRMIGALSLSELAAKLEAAGKNGDTALLASHIDGLLSRYRALGAALADFAEPDDFEIL